MTRPLELFLTLYLILMKGAVIAHGEECSTYDLEASKRCHSVLIRATNETPTDQNIATTRLLCRAWEQTRDCLLGLVSACEDKPQIAARYQRELQDLTMYKDTCSDDSNTDKDEPSLCYMPYVTEAERCTADFDMEYFERVKKNDFARACRSIEELLSCVDKVVEQVHVTCPPSTEQLIRMEEIMPFMEETSEFMNSNCDLPEQQRKLYDELVPHPPAAHGGAAQGRLPSWFILLPFILLWLSCNSFRMGIDL